MSQTITNNAPDSGNTTSEEQSVNAQTVNLPDIITYEHPYEPYTVVASKLILSDVKLLSLHEPETEEWTSAHDHNIRLKARLAQKRNQQCANELARLKEAYLVIIKETKDDKNAKKTVVALPSFVSSKERQKFVARRAVLDKGRGRVRRSRTEVRWDCGVDLWGDNTSRGEEEAGGFEEYEVEVMWEEMVLRESGRLENWCRKKSGLRKSWTVRDPSEDVPGEGISALDSWRLSFGAHGDGFNQGSGIKYLNLGWFNIV